MENFDSKINTRLKKGDKVIVNVGKESGKTGNIISLNLKKERVVVGGVNFVKKHQKATQKDKGGIVEKEASINISNVMLFCSKCDKGVRFSNILDKRAKKKVRKCKKCNSIL